MRALKAGPMRHRDPHRQPRPAATPDTSGLREARAARREATEALVETIHHGAEVRDIVNRVHEHGRRNHFLELFDATLGRKA